MNAVALFLLLLTAAAALRAALPDVGMPKALGTPTSVGGENGRAPNSAENYTLVVMWTQPDGDGAWATEAATKLYSEGLFDDPTLAQLSLVPYGDAYVNNSYSCNGGAEWDEAHAACWLTNCSKPFPWTKDMTSGKCYGYPNPGSTVCQRGARECGLLRWQGFIYLHYLTLPELMLPYYSCLQAAAGNLSLATADAAANFCASKVHVSQSMFEHLRDDYVHTWKGDGESFMLLLFPNQTKRSLANIPRFALLLPS